MGDQRSEGAAGVSLMNGSAVWWKEPVPSQCAVTPDRRAVEVRSLANKRGLIIADVRVCARRDRPWARGEEGFVNVLDHSQRPEHMMEQGE